MNVRSVRFHDAARRETRAALERYNAEAPGLGDEFLAAVEHAVRLIAEHPESGTAHSLGTRRTLVQRFPYSLVYVERDPHLVILAVAHQRRRPGYWRGRAGK